MLSHFQTFIRMTIGPPCGMAPITGGMFVQRQQRAVKYIEYRVYMYRVQSIYVQSIEYILYVLSTPPPGLAARKYILYIVYGRDWRWMCKHLSSFLFSILFIVYNMCGIHYCSYSGNIILSLLKLWTQCAGHNELITKQTFV